MASCPPHLMLPMSFFDDPNLLNLVDALGPVAGWRYVLLCHALTANAGRLDCNNPGTWKLLSYRFDCTKEEAQDFVQAMLGYDLGVLDDGVFTIPVIVDRCESWERQRSGGFKRWGKDQASPEGDDGSSTVAFLSKLPPGTMTSAEIMERAKQAGIKGDRLVILMRDYKRQNVAACAREASAYLKSRGDSKQDFLSYLESWMIRKKNAKEPPFDGANEAPRPERKRVEHVDPRVSNLVENIVGAAK